MIHKHPVFLILTFILLASLSGCGEDSPSLPLEPDEPPLETPSDTIHESPADTIDVEEPQSFPMHAIAGKLVINTEAGKAITSKTDYVNCTVSISHDNIDWCKADMTGGIRGRGNSTWEWYDKKPYRIKFDSKEEMLGLPKAKSWVLLAEYRDPTKLMNAFVFELGQLMEMPSTNHNRWVDVTLNGKDIGLYHLTEQVQQNKNRVNIDEFTGYLISLDRDDGPELAGNQADNFWSSVYRMPVCIKCPEDAENAKDDVKTELALLENAIKSHDYDAVKSLLDIDSMIDFIIIQELVYNVELDAPRSMYMFKDKDTKWMMGPLWDFDAGFDFDWGQMYTGHKYFDSYKELVLGTDPATHGGTGYHVPGFFSDLFMFKEFVAAFKTRYKDMTPLVEKAWENTIIFYEANQASWEIDQKLWPISPNYSTQIEKLRKWISNRTIYLQNIISDYSSGTY